MSSNEYTISEVCELLHISDSKLRYIEKILKINVERDKLNNRIYDEYSIDLLRKVIEYKKQGLGYKAIKVKIQEMNIKEVSDNEIKGANEEVALTVAEELLENEAMRFIFYGDDFERAITKIQEGICATVNNAIGEKFQEIDENISQKLEHLEKQNYEISEKLNKQVELADLERHFRELDNKMIYMVESKKKNHKSLFKRIFKS